MSTDLEWAHETFTDPDDDSDWFSASDYTPVLERLGTIVVRVDEEDYQGDSYVLYSGGGERSGTWAFLTFGWGSCSGCDALQGCESVEEVVTLLEQLRNDMRWGTTEEITAILNAPEREGEWYAREESWSAFREKALAALAAAA